MYRINGQVLVDDVIGKWEPLLAEYVYTFISNDFTGHDIYHCLRVKHLALRIADSEKLDRDVMVATAYLHDIGRNMERAGQGDHVSIGMSKASEILPKINFPNTRIDQVLGCIEHHEDYSWVPTQESVRGQVSVEALAFQDADRLDALGAMGIARTFAFGGANQVPLWMPEVPVSTWKHGQASMSSYNHLHEKILKLRDTMNTKTGKKLAEARHKYVEQFIEQLRREWFGEL